MPTYRVCINRKTITGVRIRKWCSQPTTSRYIADEIAKYYASVIPIPSVTEIWDLWDGTIGHVVTVYPGRL
jgi:hypothetical protein